MTKQRKYTSKDKKIKSEQIAKIEKDGENWDADELSVASDTKLEDDMGVGEKIILRTFQLLSTHNISQEADHQLKRYSMDIQEEYKECSGQMDSFHMKV